MKSLSPQENSTIAISLGGSILSNANGFNVDYACNFSEVIKKHLNKKYVIGVGGGYLAKESIRAFSKQVKNKLDLDEMGIAVTKLNALMLKNVMKSYDIDINHTIPATLDEFKELQSLHKVTVFGGFEEGVTTDTASMLAAESSSSKLLINIGTTSYIYDKPPSEKGAKPIPKMNYQELLNLAREGDKRAPGTKFIFDYVATLIAMRSKIKLVFVDDNIKELELALKGSKHNGSIVE